MSKYIDVEKLRVLLETRYNAFKIGQHSPFRNGKTESLRETIELIDSLQQEQLPGIEEHGVPGKDFIPVEWVDACEKYGKWKIVKQDQPEPELEKVARHVYESWMGGTMDDVRRDMVELGKVLNERKK